METSQLSHPNHQPDLSWNKKHCQCTCKKSCPVSEDDKTTYITVQQPNAEYCETCKICMMSHITTNLISYCKEEYDELCLLIQMRLQQLCETEEFKNDPDRKEKVDRNLVILKKILDLTGKGRWVFEKYLDIRKSVWGN